MPRKGMLVQTPHERMTDEQTGRIHDASLQILNDPGLLCYNSEASDIFYRHGAKVTQLPSADRPCWLIKIPSELVLSAINSAPKVIKLGARTENNILELSADEPRVFLATGSETNIWLDAAFTSYVKKSDSSVEIVVPEYNRRRGKVLDLCLAAKLCEHLENVDAFIRPVNIQDKDITKENKDVNKFFASLNNTTKHVMAGLTSVKQLNNVLRMAELITGGSEELTKNPIISFITCLVKSPLQLDNDTTQTLIEISRRGLPVVVSSSPQAGTTAHIREEGIISQINAEILSGITLGQLVNKGAPILYGCVPVRVRFDNLNDSYGSPESSQYNVDCIQLARFYKLPCYSTAGVCDAKIPGVQSAVERLFSDIMVTLSGPQYLHCAFGLLDGNSTFSPLQAVLDDAHFQMIKFFLRPSNMNQEVIGDSVKQIREVMATDQKLYMRYIRPLLRSGQLSTPYPFETDREIDNTLFVANKRMEQVISQPVDHIDEATTRRIFQEIPGILSRLNIY